MSWDTRPVYGDWCEEPYFIPPWAPLPAGFNPVLPLQTSVSTMPLQVSLQPLLGTLPLGDLNPTDNIATPAAINPNVGAFVGMRSNPPGRGS